MVCGVFERWVVFGGRYCWCCGGDGGGVANKAISPKLT